jgi:hypothetical protein
MREIAAITAGLITAGLASAVGVNNANEMKREEEMEREYDRERILQKQALKKRKKKRKAFMYYVHSGMRELYSAHAPNQTPPLINISFSKLKKILKKSKHPDLPPDWMLRQFDPKIASETALKAQQNIMRLQKELVELHRARESVTSINHEALQ